VSRSETGKGRRSRGIKESRNRGGVVEWRMARSEWRSWRPFDPARGKPWRLSASSASGEEREAKGALNCCASGRDGARSLDTHPLDRFPERFLRDRVAAFEVGDGDFEAAADEEVAAGFAKGILDDAVFGAVGREDWQAPG